MPCTLNLNLNPRTNEKHIPRIDVFSHGSTRIQGDLNVKINITIITSILVLYSSAQTMASVKIENLML